MDIPDKVNEFNFLIQQYQLTKDIVILDRLLFLANMFMAETNKAYDAMAYTYIKDKGSEVSQEEKRIWEITKEYVLMLNLPFPNTKLLDVGCGNGREIIYGYSIGFEVVGVDNNDKFLSYLSDLSMRRIIPQNSFLKSDMLNLGISDGSYDVIRFNASLLHIPIITKGYLCDSVLQQSYKILKQNGLIYISVKSGNDIQANKDKHVNKFRIYQMYTKDLLNKVVERNGFEVLSIHSYYYKKDIIIGLFGVKRREI